MPLIVDACVFHKVFPLSAVRSHSYGKIHAWINSNRGLITRGGAKYDKELKAARKFIPIFIELEKSHRVLKLDGKQVDKLAKKILSSEADKDFDDEHLIAMAIVSKAFGVCTSDGRAEKFIKKAAFYPSGYSRPKILKENTPIRSVSSILNSNS